MHRTGMGSDQDYKNLIRQASRTALADGWGGSMVATELQDILFGTPKPIRGKANLGVLREDQVNILVHGHEPQISEMVALASQDPELLEEAKAVGAKGINLAGICCTANELLMRPGIPMAGHMKMQEMAIATGNTAVRQGVGRPEHRWACSTLRRMSAFRGKADISDARSNVRF